MMRKYLYTSTWIISSFFQIYEPLQKKKQYLKISSSLGTRLNVINNINREK